MSVLSDIQAIGTSKGAHFHWAQFWRPDHQAGWYPITKIIGVASYSVPGTITAMLMYLLFRH